MTNKKVAVLDITSDVITLVMQDKRFADSFAFHASASYSGYQDGEFLDKSELIGVVESLIDSCRKTAFAEPEEIMVGVPAEFTSVVCRELIKNFGAAHVVTEKDVDDIIASEPPESELKTVISASPVWFTLDSGTAEIVPVGKQTSKLVCQMSYVFCTNSFVALFDKISQMTGVKFEYAPAMLAEVMYILPEDLRDAGVLLVDAGYMSTGVAYAYGDGMLGQTAFSLGRGHLAGDLVFVDGLPFENATAVVEKLNFNLHPSGGEKYFVTLNGESFDYDIVHTNDVCSARVEQIAEEIAAAAASFPFRLPSDYKIVLTGSCFQGIPGAKEIVSRVTGHETEIISPTLKPFDKPRFASLAGLISVQRKNLEKNEREKFGFLHKLKEKLFRRTNR